MKAKQQVADILNHAHMLVPVMENFNRNLVAQEAINKLLANDESWLADHSAKELVTHRAVKHG